MTRYRYQLTLTYEGVDLLSDEEYDEDVIDAITDAFDDDCLLFSTGGCHYADVGLIAPNFASAAGHAKLVLESICPRVTVTGIDAPMPPEPVPPPTPSDPPPGRVARIFARFFGGVPGRFIP